MLAFYLLWQDQDMYLFHSQMHMKQQKVIKLLYWILSNIFLYLYIVDKFYHAFPFCPIQPSGQS